MKIQKQLSKKRDDKIYHKYVVVIPEKNIKESNLEVGEELEAVVGHKSITLRKRRD